MTYEPKDWANITMLVGGWEIHTHEDARDLAKTVCEEARELENPVPRHWGEETWWQAAEEFLCEALLAEAIA